jgi:tetratricopeptide (TPR) repeat protein
MEDLGRAEASYRAAVEAYEGSPPSRGLVIALVGLAYVDRMRGRLESALEHSTGALAIAEQVGDPLQIASLLSGFGNLYRALGRLPEAHRSYERALELSEPLGDRRGVAVALMNLGRTASLLGDYRRGLDAVRRARELFLTTGDAQGGILTLGNLGTLHFYLGDFASARRYLSEYRDAAVRNGFRRAVADAEHCLGVLELELDHHEEARRRFEASLAGYEGAGDEEGRVQNRVQLARVAGRQGDSALALALARSAGERAEEIGAPEPHAESLRVEAEARRELDDLGGAQECAERALELFEEQAQPFSVAVCCRTLAKVYRDRGFEWADRASRHFERALGTFERLGARHALAVTRREYAAFLLLVEEVSRARELFADAAAVFRELGSAGELARVDRELAALGPGGGP